MTTKEMNKDLSEDQKKILFEKDTEPAFSGNFLHNKTKGIYECANCHNPLFSSNTKYESESGWPSFWSPISEDSVDYRKDINYGLNRTEVICGRCGAHLGHLFDDGPLPTRRRYCINSLALDFEKKAHPPK